MSINEYIRDNYYNLRTKLSVFKIDNFDDIYHEVLLQIIDMDNDKLNYLIEKGEIDKYIMSVFKINAFSITAPYHRKYNRIKTKELKEMEYNNDIDNDDYCLNDIYYALDKIDDFFIFKLLYKDYIDNKILRSGYSIRQLSLDSDVSSRTLISKFNIYKNEIKKINKI